jgi:hypothetical protein
MGLHLADHTADTGQPPSAERRHHVTIRLIGFALFVSLPIALLIWVWIQVSPMLGR